MPVTVHLVDVSWPDVDNPSRPGRSHAFVGVSAEAALSEAIDDLYNVNHAVGSIASRPGREWLENELSRLAGRDGGTVAVREKALAGAPLTSGMEDFRLFHGALSSQLGENAQGTFDVVMTENESGFQVKAETGIRMSSSPEKGTFEYYLLAGRRADRLHISVGRDAYGDPDCNVIITPTATYVESVFAPGGQTPCVAFNSKGGNQVGPLPHIYTDTRP